MFVWFWSIQQYDQTEVSHVSAKEAKKRKIEKVIRREFAVEIRKKEQEIDLINQVFFTFNFYY